MCLNGIEGVGNCLPYQGPRHACLPLLHTPAWVPLADHSCTCPMRVRTHTHAYVPACMLSRRIYQHPCVCVLSQPYTCVCTCMPMWSQDRGGPVLQTEGSWTGWFLLLKTASGRTLPPLRQSVCRWEGKLRPCVTGAELCSCDSFVWYR